MKIRDFFKKLKFKYNIVVIDERDLTQRANIHLSPLGLINITGLLILVSFALISLLIFATPIKNYLPGFEDSSVHAEAVHQAARVDSLSREALAAEAQIENIKAVISGEISVDSIPETDTATISRNAKLNLEASKRETEFVEKHNKETKKK